MNIATRLRDAFAPARSIKAGIAAGLKFAAPGADPNFARGSYEQPLQEVIAANLSAGDVFYDVGANVGFFSLIAARCVDPTGCVYAFEPVPCNAAAIKRNADLNNLENVHVFNEAVADRGGRADLNLAHHLGGAVLAVSGEPPDMSGSMVVDVVALDDIVARRGLRPPTLLKIDVEGAELLVLQGAHQLIMAHRPKIVFEIDDASRTNALQKSAEASAFLSGCGYGLTQLPAAYPKGSWHVIHTLAEPRETHAP
jgi:FkbM family methyltransferase